MADVLGSLKKFEFPHAPYVAVKQLESCLRGDGSSDTSIPGLGPSKEEVVEKLVEEHVFYRKTGRTGQTKRLTAIQELKLLDALNGFFQEQESENLRHSMFNTLFAHIPDRERSDTLAKLISMAVGLNNKQLLECAAVWMQRYGCSTDAVTNIASTVLHDYCAVVPDAMATLQCLPQLSIHFTCNFITALTASYNPLGYGGKTKKVLEREIVEIVAKWLESDSHLCLVSLDQSHSNYIQPQRSSLWTSPTKPNMQTSVPGLVRWCTQAPIAHAIECKQLQNSGNDIGIESISVEQNHKTEQLWSKLHLSVLQTIVDFPTLPGASQLELITLADMSRIVKDIVALTREAKNKGVTDEPYGAQCIEASVDRVVQVLQVSLATGAFRCSLADLQAICKMLPENRLLCILQNQHLTRTPPPMHHEHK